MHLTRKLVLLAVTICCSVTGAETPNPETVTEVSQAAARATIERAVQAMGGVAALQALEAIRFQVDGEIWPRLQLTTVAPSFEGGTQQESVLIDLRNDRLRVDQQFRIPARDSHVSYILTSEAAFVYNHLSRTAAPLGIAPGRQNFARYYRHLPNLLLRQVLENPGTWRALGRDDSLGKPHDVVSFVTRAGEQVSVYVDVSTSLISKSEVIYTDTLTGEEASEILYGDYARTAGQVLPRTLTLREAGDTVARYRLQVELGPQVLADSFAGPEGFITLQPNPPPTEQVERLGPGVFFMKNIAGPDQHSLAIEFDDYILAVEAPGSSAGADKLIARIKETIPGKPIRYVAITHHHGDHVGGLRSFIAEGATVITTPANREYVEALAQAPVFDRLREQRREPKIKIISNGKLVLRTGSQSVELHDIGPNPHAREMVVAYLPRERLLFVADVFIAPYVERPLGPAQAQTRAFAKRIRELGLKVERITGVHGRVATAEEFTGWTELKL
jgi:glyoxylase-like metal-dependent hydrolase (beta-lactamase superfamily II)